MRLGLLTGLALLLGSALPSSATEIRGGNGPLARQAAEPRPGMLERTNCWVLQLNRSAGARLGGMMDRVAPGAGEGPVMRVATRMVYNAINEPVAVVSHAVAGDLERVWLHVRRFAINSTAGFGGAVDRAAEWGLDGSMADLGLALCQRGVPPGPFVVLPILGPRTLRDAVSDVVLGNLVVVGLISVATGGTISLGTLIVIAVLDEVAVLAVARQMDPEAKALESIEVYDDLRTAYLERRSLRCGTPQGDR